MTLTYGIEIAVGVCCLRAVPGAWRRPRLRWLAGAAAVAGIAAVAHGVIALVT